MSKCTDGDAEAAKTGLFEDLAPPSQEQVQQARAKVASKRGQGSPRLLQPNRSQVELRASDLESLLAEDHRARLVWGYVVHQDLSKLIEAIKARGSNAGRAAIDPRILFALWLYATLDGVGSGREVARLSLEHDANRWICGGVSVNYHAINDLRAVNEALMDELLTDNVAALAGSGAISLQRVAQDGMRVRAAAGAASFGRQASLDEHLSQARELVQTIKTQAQADPGQAKRQAQAAKLRAAQEREQRIRAALEQLSEVAAAKKRNGGKAEDARASTTDADARVMKMGDGGFRPAFNVQFATTCETKSSSAWRWSTPAATWPSLRRWSSRSSSVWVRPRMSGWSMAAFPRTNRSTRWPARPMCMRRYPSQEPRKTPRRTKQATKCSRTSMHPSPVTLRKWPSGERAWPARRPKKSTSSVRPRPNASTHRRATEACCECPCAAWPRSDLWWGCSCWRTT